MYKKLFWQISILMLAAGCTTSPTPAPTKAAVAPMTPTIVIVPTATATQTKPPSTSTPTETAAPAATSTSTPTVAAATNTPAATATSDFLSTHSRTLPPGEVSHIRIVNQSGQSAHIFLYTSSWFNEFYLGDEITIEVPIESVYFYGWIGENQKFFSNVAYVTDPIHTWVIFIRPDSALVQGP